MRYRGRRAVLRQLVTVAAVAGAFAGPATAAGPVELFPGVTYERQLQFTRHGPKVVHVVLAPKPGGLYALRPELSNGTIAGRETLTALQRRLSPASTTVGINGDSGGPEGVPNGVMLVSRALVATPNPRRSAVGIDAGGRLVVGRVGLLGTWQGRGQRRPLAGVNRRPGANGVALYTSAWGPATPPEPGSVEAVLASLPPTTPNVDLTAAVTLLRQGGGTPIPPGGAVLVARGSQAQRVAEEAPVGQAASIRLVLRPDWSGVVDALGGGPLLVRDGRPVFRAGDEFAGAALGRHQARSAVGQRADGAVLLVTSDGQRRGLSVGLTNFELAQTLVRLGAVSGAAFQPGAAAALAFDGALLSRPAGAEAPLASALVLHYLGVHVPPLESETVSPNGDGLDERHKVRYKLVRPSRVNVSLVDPSGAARVVEDVERQPGWYQQSWSGTREDGSLEQQGRWRWLVTARDDRDRLSSVERPFALNTTLGFVRVGPSVVRVSPRRGRAAVSFRLAHPARVVVTVETPTGAVLRTYTRGNQVPGTVTQAWDGRYRRGALAYSGRHVIRVVATNELGRAELTASVVVRRVAG